MTVSKTAIAYITQAAMGLAIIWGVGPEEAGRLAQNLGLSLEQLVGAGLVAKSMLDAWIRKFTESPMQPGVKGLLFKREL